MTTALGPSLLSGMARNALLANTRLHKACAALPESAYRAQRPAFFGSIHGTLKHILEVDLHYLALIETGVSPFGEGHPGLKHESLAKLTAEQEAVDRKALAMVESATEEALSAEVRYTRPNGQVCVNRLADVLLHMFLHDIHHRGQVHDMLSQAGVAPPQLDEFILSEDAGLRRAEVAALGLWEPG